MVHHELQPVSVLVDDLKRPSQEASVGAVIWGRAAAQFFDSNQGHTRQVMNNAMAGGTHERSTRR